MEATLLLLNSTQVVPRSQLKEDDTLLRRKIAELNWNTVRLIAEAEKLIQESRQLSARIKSLENSSTKPPSTRC
jgi:predicted nuclease with TOPRIM domain